MLGDTIRQTRLKKRLRLKELAEKTGLTTGFLSQVERNRTDPSIASLRKISDALEVPIFSLLTDRMQPSRVVRKEERKILSLPASHVQYELLSPDVDRNIEMFIGRIASGGASSDWRLPQGEECILVLEGTMEIDVAGELYVLQAGDSIYCSGDVPHKIKNNEREELVFISSITPPSF